MFKTIQKIINIKNSEKPLFLKLFYHSFFIGIANSFFLVETSKFFLSKVKVSEIPIAYIISGILGILLVKLFKKLQQKFGHFKSYQITILIFLLSCLMIFLGQYSFQNAIIIKSIAFVGFALIFAFLTLFNVGFSGICFSVFNFSQSKRLFGLLGISEVIASIIGFLIIPFLMNYIGGANNLLLISILFSLISIYPIHQISKNYIAPTPVKQTEKQAPKKFNLKLIINNPFVYYLSLSTIFSMATFYFVDFSYLISVRNFSALYAFDTTTIVATIFCIIKAGELCFSLFTSTIISNIGMKKSGALLPNLLIIGALLCLISILLFTSSPVFIIIFLFINKWIERVIRKSITIPARKIMFQVNTPEDRIFLQNNIDGFMMQFSTVVAGIMLLVITTIIDTNNYNSFLQYISIFNLIIFSLFLFYILKLYKTYNNQIHSFLENTYQIKNDTHSKSISLAKSNENKPNTQPFQNIESVIDLNDKNKILDLILFYNPRYTSFIESIRNNDLNNDNTFKIFSKLYFENHNYFSRIAIACITKFYNFDYKVKSLKEFYNISHLSIRNHLINNLLNESNAINEKDIVYVFNLLTDLINEILWTDAGINDLVQIENLSLIDELNSHKNQLCNLLLNLLQFNHDKNSIIIIKNIINKVDFSEEDAFFVCELFDNILLPNYKNIVIPIFEPISFINKKNKLKDIVHVSSLSINDRLIDILMHDYKIVNLYCKELALSELFKRGSQSEIGLAFEKSQYVNLQFVSTNNKETLDKLNVLSLKTQIADTLSTSLSLHKKDIVNFINYGFRDTSLSLQNNVLQTNLNNYSREYKNTNALMVGPFTNLDVDFYSLFILKKFHS